MKLGSAKPKWPWWIWHWTCANESLFDLSKEDLSTFVQLINEASK